MWQLMGAKVAARPQLIQKKLQEIVDLVPSMILGSGLGQTQRFRSTWQIPDCAVVPWFCPELMEVASGAKFEESLTKWNL